MDALLETERLRLGRLSLADAAFIHDLVTDEAWLRFIGDSGVRTLGDARTYLEQGPLACYAQHGFGLYRVERRDSGVPVGICGLLERDSLSDVDVGYAVLPRHRGRGYASEAVLAVVKHARRDFGLERLVAVTDPENGASIRILEKAGFRRESSVQLRAGEPELSLYARDLDDADA